jgi:hypothetical protein
MRHTLAYLRLYDRGDKAHAYVVQRLLEDTDEVVGILFIQPMSNGTSVQIKPIHGGAETTLYTVLHEGPSELLVEALNAFARYHTTDPARYVFDGPVRIP